MSLDSLKHTFKNLFNLSPDTIFFAPGRVNLIGEHIDYNGGLVFPCAITKGTYAVVSKRTDFTFKLYSENFKGLGIFTLSLDALEPKKEDHWTNYVKGVLSILLKKGHSIPFGLNMVIYGDLPNGAGLSSSASLEMLMCKIFNTYYHLQISPDQMALIGKQVENEYIGVNSGIMDQFAIALGKQDSALLLDCATQHYEYVPFNMQNYELVIMNTNKRRELADSKYNERRSECETALSELQTKLAIKTLGDFDLETFDEYSYLIKEENRIKRARHAVSENQRTLEARKALEAGNLERFGRLMNASHVSLEHDYEVTGLELDTLVHTAWQQEGVLGARMTGAGFGGCGIAIVKKDKVEDFKTAVGKRYVEVVGYAPDFYVAEIASGSKVLSHK